MGNRFERMSLIEEPKTVSKSSKKFEPVDTYLFHEVFLEDSNNGLYLNGKYFPEEVVTMILSNVDPKHLLKCTEVCKKWCNIIKSHTFWASVYYTRYRKKPKKLPWYVYYCLFTTDYFDNNLIKNGNGQEQYKYWTIVKNYGDEFQIEDPPNGSNPLPPDVPEFKGKTSCFATSYYECNKFQEISLENNRLMQLIFNKYRPHIYMSEWVAGRFDCGCVYNLWCKLYGSKSDKVSKEVKARHRNDSDSEVSEDTGEDDEEVPLHLEHVGTTVEQWAGSEWSKVELLVQKYPKGVQRIVFQHEGRDTQFWKGHYGSKMAGGVLKILFDSIEPPEENLICDK